MSHLKPLRLLTINTWKCDGPYEARIEALKRQIAALDPDVIALQESFRTLDGSVDTALSLAQALRMHVQFAPARRKFRELGGRMVESESGLALLSRDPFASVTRIELPTDSPLEERIALLGRLRWGEHEVALCNIHLTHLPSKDELRWIQLDTALTHIAQVSGAQTRIVCGDFNTPLPHLDELLSNRPMWTLRDTYELGGGVLPDRSTIRGIGADWPMAVCLDYILECVPMGQTSSMRFSESHVVLNRPDAVNGEHPSDHYGVMTTMHFVDGGDIS